MVLYHYTKMFIGLTIYLLIGLFLAYLADRAEMKKPLPYSFFPAIPLSAIRFGVYFWLMILSPIYLPKIIFKIFKNGIYHNDKV